MESALYREIFEEGESRGEAKGKAAALVQILQHRLGHGDEVLSQRIRAETRLDVLNSWLDEAVLAIEPQEFQQLAIRIRRTPPP